MRKKYQVEGSPYPQGASYVEDQKAFNFSLYSKNAAKVVLLIYGDDVEVPQKTIEFDPKFNKTNEFWHIRIGEEEIPNAKFYAYRVWGPAIENGNRFHAFDPDKILIDPYAKNVFLPPKFSRDLASLPGKNDGTAPLGVIPPAKKKKKFEAHNWVKDYDHLIIYELHVKQFTANDHTIEEKHRGTYQGIIDKIPYLQELGVTAVELMPVHQWDPLEGSAWGYMTLNYFSPHKDYSSNKGLNGHIKEFKRMVKALCEAEILVILDVVYNHTTESDIYGPVYSFKGIDNSIYYLPRERDGKVDYADFSGTGNTFKSANHQPRKLILDSLRYWVTEFGISGFRFDLGSIFALDAEGRYSNDFYSILDQISHDPILQEVVLIAEPWDGDFDDQGYLLGMDFPGLKWKQWNDKGRMQFRQTVKGDNGMIKSLMTRLYGSNDLFPGPEDNLALSRTPAQSLNYISSHDGLTLYDLVSYTHTNQQSWDSGHHGVEKVPKKVLNLRKQQVKNFITLLMLSNGTPMFRAGDEFLQTQYGQANPYNIDDETVWLDWKRKEEFADVQEYFKNIISFRKKHPSIDRGRFWQDDVTWFGPEGKVDASYLGHTLSYHLKGTNEGLRLEDKDLYVMINTYWEAVKFKIMVPGDWKLKIDTSKSNGDDFIANEGKAYKSKTYKVKARSVVVLVK